MTEFVYAPLPAVDPTTSTVVRNTTGQLYAVTDTTFATPLAFRDLSGVPQAVLRVGPLGITDEFRIDDQPEVLWKSGDYVIHLWSPQGVLDAVTQVLQETQDLAAAMQAIIAGGGGGGGGLPAGTTLDAILNGVDRWAIPRTELQRLATMQTNATALVIGTTATTAKAGNYQPTPVQIGAVQNVAGFGRVWGRTVAQGFPTAAEGRQDGDYVALTSS
jgi:hypothetical protein